MIMKLMCSGSDFERSLRHRRLLSIGLLALGILGLACYFLLVNGSDRLLDSAQGFYLGASSGITAGAFVLLLRIQYLITHPDARTKARIQENDEREQAIVFKAFQFAGILTFFLCAAAMFVLVALNRAAADAVFAVIVVYALTWAGANVYFSKKI